MDLQNLLDWLTGADAGAFLVVTWFASWGLEKASFWQKISSQLKAVTILVLAGILGGGSGWLSANPKVVGAIQPYVQPAIYGALAWLGSQTAHKFNTRA